MLLDDFNLRLNALNAEKALKNVLQNPSFKSLDYSPDLTVSDALQAITALLEHLQENKLDLPRNIEALINE